jgi:hypothetical protein
MREHFAAVQRGKAFSAFLLTPISFISKTSYRTVNTRRPAAQTKKPQTWSGLRLSSSRYPKGRVLQ